MQILTYVFDLLYFTQCLTSFSSIDHLRLCARFLILFHLTYMRFSQSTGLLMPLSSEILSPIIRIGLSILVEVINLVNSVIIFFYLNGKMLHGRISLHLVLLVLLLRFVSGFRLELIYISLKKISDRASFISMVCTYRINLLILK